ncbi:MAG: hypothetical protein ACI9MC_001400 [Kiritimatiellia bacterium]|jgi:hypothetical protein
MAMFNTHAVFPLPTLDDKQREQLLAGKVVKIVERHEGSPSTAIALLIVDQPIEAIWIASLDPHLTVDPDLVEIRLDDRSTHRELWYGYLDLPMPFSDRQWMVDSWSNHKLAAASGGKAWEHAWKLSPLGIPAARPAVAKGQVPGITTAMLDVAIAMPDNQGAWLTVGLADGSTVLGYHATSTIGGSVPDWLVFQLVMSRLDSLLRRVETRCDGLIHEHYTQSHVHGGDGVEIPVRKLKR